MIDYEAIKKAYPDAGIISDRGTFKEDGTEITIVQSEVDTARATIDSEAVAFKYKTDRTTDGSTTYAPIGDQLDLLWHAIDADSDLKVKFSAFYNSIKAVKAANPKP